MFQKYSASRGTVVHFSLKRRILSLFFTLIFLSFLGFSTLTGNTIYHLVDNKITANYKSNLDQTCVSIQNILQNLSLVSQRLAYESELQKQLAEYLSSTAIRKKIVYIIPSLKKSCTPHFPMRISDYFIITTR